MIKVIVSVMLAKLVTGVFDPELHEKYLSMPEDEFIEYFNSQGYSYKMTMNKVVRKYGTHIDFESIKDYPVQSYDDDLLKNLPKNFDVREKWPNCKSIKEIYDQGDCGSCWAFGAATTASDRTCIHKGINVNLSEQDLECQKKLVCKGGTPIAAFDFWKSDGLVSNDCKPYNITQLHEGKCLKECTNKSIDYKHDKHYGDKIYLVPDRPANKIKAELFHFGSVQAIIEVYKDLQKYKGGIYVYTHGEYCGAHGVRIIGYGVKNGTEYWLVANNWGKNWGENGLFRVKTYQEDLYMETFLVTGLPKN